MNIDEFEIILNHAPKGELLNIATIMEESLFVPINMEQNRFEMIDTLFGVYYKEKERIHDNSFSEPNHLTTFDYKIHYSCPFNEENSMRYPYFIVADRFGFSTKISRKDARAAVKEAYDELNKYVDERYCIYRMIQILTFNFRDMGMFAKSFKDRKTFILYEVIDWKDGKAIINAPI